MTMPEPRPCTREECADFAVDNTPYCLAHQETPETDPNHEHDWVTVWWVGNKPAHAACRGCTAKRELPAGVPALTAPLDTIEEPAAEQRAPIKRREVTRCGPQCRSPHLCTRPEHPIKNASPEPPAPAPVPEPVEPPQPGLLARAIGWIRR